MIRLGTPGTLGMVKLTPDTYQSDSLYPRVAKAMDEILAAGLPVSAPAVFERMGMLSSANSAAWRRGEVPYLERVTMGSLSKLNRIVRIIALYAHDLNLPPAPPHAAGPIKVKRRPLQFSKTGAGRLENAYKRVFYPRRVSQRSKSLVEMSPRRPPPAVGREDAADEGAITPTALHRS